MPDLRPEVSPGALATFLSERLGGPIDGLHPLRPGELARVFAFDLTGQARVVRLAASGQGFEADRVAYERFVRRGLPVPRVTRSSLIDGMPRSQLKNSPIAACAVSRRAAARFAFATSLVSGAGATIRVLLVTLATDSNRRASKRPNSWLAGRLQRAMG